MICHLLRCHEMCFKTHRHLPTAWRSVFLRNSPALDGQHPISPAWTDTGPTSLKRISHSTHPPTSDLEPSSLESLNGAELGLLADEELNDAQDLTAPHQPIGRPHSPAHGHQVAGVQGREWVFETGRLARVAHGGCTIRSEGTTVLATVVASPFMSAQARRDPGSLPLTIDYREKLYAVGRIPGTYNKREGSPKEHELLAGRRLERALRPLFPSGYAYGTDITASVLSADGKEDPEVIAITAASAALIASDIPWNGPLGSARVRIVDGCIHVGPLGKNGKEPQLSMLVAATADRVVLVEMDGDQVPEDRVIEALRAGLESARGLLSVQCALAGREKVRGAETAGADPAAARRIWEMVRSKVKNILRSPDFQDCKSRKDALIAGKAEVADAMRAAGSWRAEFARVAGSGCVSSSDIDHTFAAAISSEVRKLAMEEGLRLDGRGLIDVRPFEVHVDHVPVVHGSAVVDAGETQSLCTVTVGSKEDQQRMESLLGGEGTKRLFVNYAVPDFALAARIDRSTAIGGPIVRHEMDRSLFVERALSAVLPPEKEFPFTVRLNIETLAADGGSACMAVSGGAAAMADAGVPLRDLVAGISVGLLSEGGGWNGEAYTISERSEEEGSSSGEADQGLGRYEVIVDPTAVEVAFGDMELRVAGTTKGITAIQLDARVPGGVPEEVLIEALARAQVGRLRVLSTLKAATSVGRGESAPMFDTVRVPADAVGQVIGREGAAIRAVEAASGARVHVGDRGELSVFAPSTEQFRAAKEALLASAGAHLELGELYKVKVAVVKDFGAFVTIPGSEARALLHISEVALERIRAVEDVLKPGDEVEVAFLGRDTRGTLRVSRKAALLKASKRTLSEASS